MLFQLAEGSERSGEKCREHAGGSVLDLLPLHGLVGTHLRVLDRSLREVIDELFHVRLRLGITLHQEQGIIKALDYGSHQRPDVVHQAAPCCGCPSQPQMPPNRTKTEGPV